MGAALVWFVVALLLVAGEVVSGDFFLLMLAGGAVGASVAGLVVGPVLQALVFAVVSVGLVVGVRPPLKRRLGIRPSDASGSAALVGQDATVLELTTAHGGQVKLAGEVWTARSLDESVVLEPGRTVKVMEIDGATAVVWDGPY